MMLRALLLIGVIAGFGSAAFSAARHASGAHCHASAHHEAGWRGPHDRWRRGPAEAPATPEASTIQP